MVREIWDNLRRKKSTWVVLALMIFIGVGFIGSQFFGSSGYNPDAKLPETSSSSSSETELVDDTNKPPKNMSGDVTGINSLIEAESAKSIFRDNYDKLNLPGALQYKGTEPLATQTFIGMGKSFQIALTKNWLSNIDANNVSLIHTSGPSLVFQQSKLTGDFTTSQVNKTISTFLEDCGITEAFANDIFLKDKVIGRLASALYTVDGESHILDCAVFVCDKEVYTMISLYRSDDEEIVTSLYRAITYKGTAIKFK